MSDYYDEDEDNPSQNFENDLYGEYTDDEDFLKEVEDLNIPDFDQHSFEDANEEKAKDEDTRAIKTSKLQKSVHSK
ncbi:MAG TPA: hypothetical protein VJC17_00355 [Candidatus Dojkabacteria bacterium]|nr:hypothetical protein [Candidatus Dojkabacteria bacterium]